MRNAKHIVAAAVKAAKEGDWRAGAWLYERAYGKPEQRLEVETPGTLSEIAAMTPEERKALRARLLREHPQLLELIPEARAQRLPGPSVEPAATPTPAGETKTRGTPAPRNERGLQCGESGRVRQC